MKVFEAACVLSACMAVANCQQDSSENWTNPFRSPATFKPERYGEYEASSYYESYKPRAPHDDTAFNRKFPHGADYPPVFRGHGTIYYDNDSPDQNVEEEDAKSAESQDEEQ